MIVSVVGASSEAVRARAAMDAVIFSGKHELGVDWLALIEKHGSANRGVPQPTSREIALASFGNLRRSDVLWILFPKKPTIGTWIETGAFMFHSFLGDCAKKPTIVMSGGDPRESIYLNGLVDHSFVFDAETMAWLTAQP